ncbi:uncharacterized protein [Haliotis asinina]|uniref:uncharacterized protein n=1 Tax=Haliotis asinina TaxID=109174 RepID=UPI003531BFE9
MATNTRLYTPNKPMYDDKPMYDKSKGNDMYDKSKSNDMYDKSKNDNTRLYDDKPLYDKGEPSNKPKQKPPEPKPTKEAKPKPKPDQPPRKQTPERKPPPENKPKEHPKTEPKKEKRQQPKPRHEPQPTDKDEGPRPKRVPSRGNATVVIVPGHPRGLTPPRDRYSPGTVVVTPDLPPPGPMFPRERTPRRIKNLWKPPTPSRHRRRRRELPRTPRQGLRRRDFVDSPPPTPWSEHPDQGSMMSLPRDYQDTVISNRSIMPVKGSVISGFTRTLVNEEDVLRTPVSSRWTFPRYNVRAPSNHTFRTFPQEPLRRYDATPRPPKTSWSKVPRRGSLIAPPWSEKRLVADPQISNTAAWVGRHSGYAAEYSSRPMWLGYDVETDSDILQTPLGPRRFIGQEPEATDTARWVERNFGDSRDWLDTPYFDGRYYQYDRRYLDSDQYTEYNPNRDYYPTNPILYNEKAYSTSRWVNKNFSSDPILLERERRRHRYYEPGRGHPKRLIPVRDYSMYGSDPGYREQRHFDHKQALRETERYKNLNRKHRRAYDPPESIKPRRGSHADRLSPEIPPDRYDRHGDDESQFSRVSAKSYNNYRPKEPTRDPGWDRYKDYSKEMNEMGPSALPGRDNVHRWLSNR